MTSKHRIVVSTENNAYSGWQCKLFYFSCATRLKRQPMFIVHASGDPWHPDFYALAKAGATVVPAPSYVGKAQAPRNTAGTLLHAAELCREDEFIVLCDPDMIFVRAPELPKQLSGNYCSYLTYSQPAVQAAAKGLGLDAEKLGQAERQLCCGVPYVIPAGRARALAKEWMAAVDAFPQRHWEDMWLDIMYAFGLAALKLGLDLALTDLVDDNDLPHAPQQRELIHYCYGGDVWNKRWFYWEEQASLVWEARASCAARPETVLGEILMQISEAREFYRDVYSEMRSNLPSPPTDLTARSGGGGI